MGSLPLIMVKLWINFKTFPMKSAKLNAFVPVRSISIAEKFYVQTLGLELKFNNGFALQVLSGEVPVRLTLVENFEVQPFTIMGWEVENIKASIQDLNGKGIVFERFPQVNQDEYGIWSAPGGTQVAWFKDPDGNLLSLSES